MNRGLSVVFLLLRSDVLDVGNKIIHADVLQLVVWVNHIGLDQEFGELLQETLAILGSVLALLSELLNTSAHVVNTLTHIKIYLLGRLVLVSVVQHER